MKIEGIFITPVGFSENPNHKIIKDKFGDDAYNSLVKQITYTETKNLMNYILGYLMKSKYLQINLVTQIKKCFVN